jgi:hypothetical protein
MTLPLTCKVRTTHRIFIKPTTDLSLLGAYGVPQLSPDHDRRSKSSLIIELLWSLTFLRMTFRETLS